MFQRLVSTTAAVSLGALLLLPSGCNTKFDDAYQTFSTKDAERVEQARDARETDADASKTETDAETEVGGDGRTSQRSPVVQAAAQAVARAVQPSDEQPSDEQPPAGDAAAPTPQSDVSKTPTAAEEDGAPSLARAAAVKAASVAVGEPVVRTPKLLVPERSFAVEGPGDALRVSYDDFDLLKVLNMEPVPPDAVDHFPKWLADLDGKPVRVRGFMYPTFQETDIPGFVLARDNQICCFGRNPKIYDLVEVTLKDGVTTDYIQGRPFDVVGTFHIAPEADDGELWQLYQIDNAIVVDH